MFDEIKKKYPKAWEKFINWFAEKTSVERLDSEHYILNMFFEHRSGWLFRFFDEQRIYISVIYSGIEYYYQRWDQDMIETSDDTFKSRTDAEKSAFEKAFEILEGKE